MGLSINKKPKNSETMRGKNLKKAALMLTVATIVLVFLVSIPFNIKTAKTSNGDYSIENVNHEVKILYNGYILINDTITMTGQASSTFYMGFPIKYEPYILQVLAYNESEVFSTSLNAPLEDRIGFYGVEIDFPHGNPQIFTVGFILSNYLLSQYSENSSYYFLDFPAYPSLTRPALVCEGSILLKGASYVSGSVESFTYRKENLTEFTSAPANVTFSFSGSNLQLMDVRELKREVTVNEIGEIAGLDEYYVINEGLDETSFIEVVLPLNASNPSAADSFGRTLSDSLFVDEKTGRYKVSFTLPIKFNESTRFAIQYSLPNQIYISTQGGTNLFNLTLLQFLNVSYYVEQASITFILPEGARILSYATFNVARSAFQESLTMELTGISPLENLFASTKDLQASYEYNPLWLAFRPTLWMWAIAIIGCSIFVAWKRPKAPEGIPAIRVAVTAKLRPEDIKSFISAYDEKRKITSNVESLESKVQKGKIPRRRYKVQRKTLETRLNSLLRTIAESKEKMRAAGSQYADFARQLEIAEAETSEVEANIKSIEARHNRGELSLEAYRRLLADYERRKEKAGTAIDGILLRLREETR